MNLTKNQIYIISAVILAVVVYFMFFRKKGTTSTDANKMTMPPAAGESNWMPQYPSQAALLGSMRMDASNSVAGMLGQSNYAGLPAFQRPTALAGDATDWLYTPVR